MPPPWLRSVEVWNQRVHIWVGLACLWFLWLFALSGLLLNHPRWTLLPAWEQRRVETRTLPVQQVEPQGDLQTARALMGQLGLTGEVGSVSADPAADRFAFGVSRPGTFAEVSVDWARRQAEVKVTRIGAWGALVGLHTANGGGGGRHLRDWLPTTLWVVAMDGLCVGLFVLVASSLLMWLQAGRLRRLEWAVLGAGVLCCAFFLWGT
ncbi:MAG: PepSY-associated TM helix domain-containing protein [Candidatus Latescibacterota bacterium]